MTHLLAVESAPYRVLSGWVAMVRASLVWLLCCLPVVTAPAATRCTARSKTTVAAGEPGPGFAESLRLVRTSCWPALRLGAVVVLGYGVVGSAVLGPSPGGPWDVVLPIVVLPVAATWVLVSQWAFPVIEERSDGVRAAFTYAYLRAIRRPDLALMSAIGAVALVAIGMVLPTAVWVPYWLTVPALWAWLTTATSRQAAASARTGQLLSHSELSHPTQLSQKLPKKKESP